MEWKSRIADGLGIVIIVAWLALVGLLWLNRSDSEILWSKSTFIFGSVEAIAFAAAGYYFGKEVHRERADNAEARDKQHEQEANKFRTNGLKLQTKIEELAKADYSGFNILSSLNTRNGLVSTFQSANSKDIGAVLNTPSLHSQLQRIVEESKDYFQ